MSYLGIDLGTSSVKALLVDENLNVLASKTADYPLLIEKSGFSEQNPNDWYEQTLAVIKSCLTATDSQIKAISFSGQMHGLVLLDDHDNVLRPAILWNDQRSTKECDYLNKTIGQDKLLKWTQNIALTGFTAPKLLWVKNNEPEIFAKISKIMLPKDYLAYKLSGIFATDVSDASGTLYFDVKNKKYSQEMLNILEINTELLPKIHESNAKIGIIKPDILDVDYKIDIIIGGGDQAVGALGCKNINDGDVNISLGTSGVVFSPCIECHENSLGELHSFCDATGKYHTMGVMLSAAGSVNWWYEQILKKADYSQIAEELRKANASNLFYLPFLTGERSVLNDPNIRGSFHNLSLEHSQIDMTLAVIEGVTFFLKQIYDSMKIGNCKQIKVTSGGAKNLVWLQIIADVFDVDVITINAEHGPALGAAILAISGSQNISINDVYKDSIKIQNKISPSSKVELYSKKYETFKKIYPIVKTISYD